MENETVRVLKRPGRIAGPPTVRTSLLIEEELVEWGKQQTGGLSGTVRDLLRDAKEKASRGKK